MPVKINIIIARLAFISGPEWPEKNWLLRNRRDVFSS